MQIRTPGQPRSSPQTLSTKRTSSRSHSSNSAKISVTLSKEPFVKNTHQQVPHAWRRKDRCPVVLAANRGIGRNKLCQRQGDACVNVGNHNDSPDCIHWSVSKRYYHSGGNHEPTVTNIIRGGEDTYPS